HWEMCPMYQAAPSSLQHPRMLLKNMGPESSIRCSQCRPAQIYIQELCSIFSWGK
ncbi:Hypothetical predicted protein, partial [Marmota monax]